MLRRPAAIFVALLLAASGTARSQTLRMVVSVDDPGPTISRHIYGHFAEHLGRDIYGGFWVKDDGGEWTLNQPVVEAMRRLDPPNIRWPGGCFADIYHWRDGIGPRDRRPGIVNSLWGGVTEDNSFGTDEFMALAEAIGAEPFVVGNVGSGTVREMAQWWEYLNHPGPGPMADLRARNGHPEPWGVRFWGVGNESWACGGNMSPEHYADLYRQFVTFLHGYGDVRPFRIATGPNDWDGMDEWADVVMREAGRLIDGLDMHYYTVVGPWQHKGSATTFTEGEWIEAMREALAIEDDIRTYSTIMDRYDPDKRVWLVVGEWGIWHDVEPGTDPGFLYQQNSMRDALVAALSLNIFNRHADRVRMANIAQTINVLQAMILTEEDGDGLVLTPTYHVFEMLKGHQDATLLPITLDAGEYSHDGTTIPAVSASASTKDGRVLLTVANLDPGKGRTVEASLRGTSFTVVSGRILTAETMNAHNTFDDPDAVRPVSFDGARLDGGRLVIDLPARSLVVLEIR